MYYRKFILSLFIVFASISFAHAQRAELGLDLGGAGYMGDLNPNNPVKISGLHAGLFGRINFDPYWGLGLHYNYGKIKANDLNSTNQQFFERGLNFNTAVNEVSLIANLNFFDIYSPISKRRFTPYIFAGIGGIYYKPKAIYDGSAYLLPNFQTNIDDNGTPVSYKPYAIVLPFGAGAKYKLTEEFTLFSQIGYRTAYTDYLDDVGGNYVDTSTPFNPNPQYLPPYNGNLTSNPNVGVFGTQRGDSRKRDTYMFVSIGISYNFVSQKCFTF